MKERWKKLSLLSLLILPMLGAVVFIVACGGGRSSQSVTPNPVPSIQSVSPTFVTAGASSQTLTVSGTGFLASSTVTFNGAPHSASFVNSGQLNITLTTSDLASAGNFPIVVTNPPPGGGSSASDTFAIWNSVANTSSSLTFSVPPLGTTPQITYSGSSSYALFSLEIAAANPHYGNAVTPVIRLFALSNPSQESIQQWFEDNVDDASGTLIASGAFQLQTLANGQAIIDAGPIPSTYQGGPVAYGYLLSSSQNEVYVITQSQGAQLTEFGYSASSVPNILTSILGSIQ